MLTSPRLPSPGSESGLVRRPGARYLPRPAHKLAREEVRAKLTHGEENGGGVGRGASPVAGKRRTQ